jgi:hypothetical protein
MISVFRSFTVFMRGGSAVNYGASAPCDIVLRLFLCVVWWVGCFSSSSFWLGWLGFGLDIVL